MDMFSGILLASDLDGTLLDHNKQITPGNLRAIERFVKKGGLFTVSTGRSKNSARRYYEQLTLSAPAILCNGALTFDTQRKLPEEVFLLPPEACSLVAEIKSGFPEAGLELYREDDTFLLQESETSRRHFALIGEAYRLTRWEDVPKDKWIKLLVTGAPEMLRKAGEMLRAAHGDDYQIVRSEEVYLEIFNRETDKGRAMLRVAERRGISPRWVCAVGDHLNDLSMLKAAGYAMTPQNAVAEAKALADFVLPSCDEDAIAAAIDQIEKMRRNELQIKADDFE